MTRDRIASSLARPPAFLTTWSQLHDPLRRLGAIVGQGHPSVGTDEEHRGGRRIEHLVTELAGQRASQVAGRDHVRAGESVAVAVLREGRFRLVGIHVDDHVRHVRRGEIDQRVVHVALLGQAVGAPDGHRLDDHGRARGLREGAAP